MAVMTPGGTTGWNIQKWQRTIEGATYQKMVLIPVIDEGDRPLNTLNIRKKLRATGNTLGQSDVGTTLTYSTLTDTPVTVTPVGSYVAAAWSQNQQSQIDVAMDDESRGEIEQALAELTDTNACAAIVSLTTVMSQAEVDGPMLRKAMGRLMGNTNGVAMPGGPSQIYGIFSNTQYPALANIEEFNRAEVRGDSENPYVKGVWTRGGGIMLLFTTVITQDTNGWHNALFIPSAFVVAWNTRSLLKRQDLELQERIIAYNNVGTAVKHNFRAVALRTTTSVL